MLFNVLNNTALKATLAIPADEGLSDEAFELGWRILIPARKEAHIATTIERREAWEWNMYLYDAMNSGESLLLVDDERFTPYVEDVADEWESDNDILPEDPEPADETVEHNHDMVETMHFLNLQ